MRFVVAGNMEYIWFGIRHQGPIITYGHNTHCSSLIIYFVGAAGNFVQRGSVIAPPPFGSRGSMWIASSPEVFP